MIIDSHTHIFSEKIIKDREEYLKDGTFSTLYSYNKARMSTTEDILESMENNGVDYSICFGFSWENSDVCNIHNEYLLEAREQSGGKLIPFAAVPSQSGFDYYKYFSNIKSSGFIGVGELGFYKTGLLTKEEEFIKEIIPLIKELGLIINFHVNEPVGHTYIGKHAIDFSAIYRTIKANQGVKIILSHYGGGLPYFEQIKEVKANFKNVYYDTAASHYIYDKSVHLNTARIIGSKKILFGSDYPLLSPQVYFSEIKESGLTQEETDDILFKNAATLFGIDFN